MICRGLCSQWVCGISVLKECWPADTQLLWSSSLTASSCLLALTLACSKLVGLQREQLQVVYHRLFTLWCFLYCCVCPYLCMHFCRISISKVYNKICFAYNFCTCQSMCDMYVLWLCILYILFENHICRSVIFYPLYIRDLFDGLKPHWGWQGRNLLLRFLVTQRLFLSNSSSESVIFVLSTLEQIVILFLSDLYTQVNELCSNLSASKPGVICTQLEMQVGQKMSKMCQYFHG